MIIELQQLKGKTNLKFYKNINNHYEMKVRNFKFEEDTFSKNARGISKIHHEELLLMRFSKTKPIVKKMSINYYDLYYTIIKNRDDKEIVNDEYEKNENGYCNLNDFITPNHYIGRKKDNEILK